MSVDVYAALDLRGGRCVRLVRGDFGAETAYDDDPVAVARRFAAAGVRWVHVVDLDAARTGEHVHLEVIERICATVPCSVQAGGGVRDAESAGALIGSGVSRVVLGTAAIEQPSLVEELSAMHPRQIAVGLDARGRDVAVRGWMEASGADVVDLARRFDGSGASALVVTQISRDGTMEGPDVAQLRAVLEATTLPVVASGGVGSLDHLRDLRGLRAGGRGLAGVIVGTALYEHKFDITEALAAVG